MSQERRGALEVKQYDHDGTMLGFDEDGHMTRAELFRRCEVLAILVKDLIGVARDHECEPAARLLSDASERLMDASAQVAGASERTS